jgi:hypothetical protein
LHDIGKQSAAGTLDAVPESTDMAAFSTPPVAKPVPLAELPGMAVGEGGVIAPLTLIISDTNRGFAGGEQSWPAPFAARWPAQAFLASQQ